MTVAELIVELQRMPQDAPVMFPGGGDSGGYGDVKGASGPVKMILHYYNEPGEYYEPHETLEAIEGHEGYAEVPDEYGNFDFPISKMDADARAKLKASAIDAVII